MREAEMVNKTKIMIVSFTQAFTSSKHYEEKRLTPLKSLDLSHLSALVLSHNHSHISGAERQVQDQTIPNRIIHKMRLTLWLFFLAASCQVNDSGNCLYTSRRLSHKL